MYGLGGGHPGWKVFEGGGGGGGGGGWMVLVSAMIGRGDEVDVTIDLLDSTE